MKFKFPDGKLNKFLNEYYNHLALAMVLIVLAIGTFVLLLPQYQNIRTNGTLEHKQALALLTERQTYLDNLKIMKTSHEDLSLRAWQSLNYILPHEQDIYLTFAQIEALARDYNVGLSSININQAEQAVDSQNSTNSDTATTAATVNTPGNLKEVQININIDGVESYNDFKTFLDNLEQNIRILNINSLSYSPGKTAYTITVTTYYLRDESTISETSEEEVDEFYEQGI